ncbi:TetR/AcrR family transcriptional regulator [Williamsia sp.]|uniref:TetR/AcrR family transcriptional regulator n=1 Tax=Williamsia sp. TaxID=1872085 RepID=UPI001A1BA460|nr:TetR/AcrR family transcriptional regulator [Williamsia sp.]MBJ7291483.1 TetR/AcrR family transcriptional regulator [Williamsia sp.]
MPVARGRPRSTDIDEAVRDAVIVTLAQRGYAAMTIDGVARDAGVAKTAIYRRWPSKAEMVFALVIHGSEISAPADHGDLRDEVTALVERIVELLGAPAVRGCLPALLTDLRANPQIARRFRTSVIDPERAVVREIVARADRRGELRDGVDPDDVHAHVLGMVFAWVHLIDDLTAPDFTRRTVRSVLAVMER